MTIQIAIEHATRYQFDRPVRAFPHIVRLRPAPHCRTPITAYSLQVEPGDHFINWQQDPFGNHLARLVFPEPITELSFTVDLVADMTVINPFDFFVDEDARTYPFRYDRALARGLGPYFTPMDADGPLLLDWVADIGHEDIEPVNIVDFLVEVNGRLHRDIAYSVRMEVGVQAPEHTLERGIGSCRDSAWLLVQILRRLGLAARFVSGYLVQLRTDVPALDGPAGPTSDFTDLHAWAEVFVPGAGWIGLDPTSGLMAGEGHIPLACTPEPDNAAPVTGAVEPCETIFSFHNVVRRIHEDPRVTLPYDSDQWQRIDALGMAVDERLRAGDVRLTVGGEPTFVAVDDMESPQWTIAADGADKRARASALASRLRDRMAPGSVTLHTQGKWYPGEPLPRWALELVWRADGTALWSDQSLLVDPWTPTADSAASSSIDTDAARLVGELRDRLGLPPHVVLEAHEDPLHALLAQVSAPLGERPGEVHDALVDTRRALSTLSQLDGLDSDTVAGWVMPLHRRAGSTRWATCRWRFRRGQLFLLPGDSPLGLRLPLNAVSWTPPNPVFERSPFEDVDDLASPEALAAA
ncbi:MAG: transglutaminase family protein, partial [Acidimicrobiia bacterium]